MDNENGAPSSADALPDQPSDAAPRLPDSVSAGGQEPGAPPLQTASPSRRPLERIGAAVLVLVELALAGSGAFAVLACIAALPIIENSAGFQSTEEMEAYLTSARDRSLSRQRAGLPQIASSMCARVGGSQTEAARGAPPSGGEFAIADELDDPRTDAERELERDCRATAARVEAVEGRLTAFLSSQRSLWIEAADNTTTDALARLRRGLAVPQTNDDQLRFVARLRDEHSDSLQNLARAMTDCESAVIGSLAPAKTMASGSPAAEWPAELSAIESDQLPDSWCRDLGSLARTRQQYSENRFPEEALGAFGTLTLGLHRTRSPDLIILVGMIGCGLLGAGISSLLRRRRGESSGAPSIRIATPTEIISVLVSGFTAALLVFLGVKSGLAVVAGDGAEVNPYFMLFLCLIGSVFSDTTWRWGRQQMSQFLPAPAPPEPEASVTEAPVAQTPASAPPEPEAPVAEAPTTESAQPETGPPAADADEDADEEE